MFGAAAMSLSSFCVVTNALRLNLFRMHDASHDHKSNHHKPIEMDEVKESEETMKKVMHIEGIMCGHCEARIKSALEAVEGVEHAEVSHTKGTAVVKLSADVSDEVLTKAVEDQDYKVVSVKKGGLFS